MNLTLDSVNETIFTINFGGEPLQFRHWYLFTCLLFFLIWNTFTLFYFSRIVGPIIAFILTRVYRLKGSNVYFSLGSFSLSPLSGKIMFRDFSYTCCDYSIRCNDGWIKFSYWRYVSANPLSAASNTSRVHITLYGLQIHIFNRLSEYKKLAKIFGLEKFFASLKEQTTVVIPKKLTEKQEQAWDSFYDKLWSLVGYVKLSIGSGKFIAGNCSLPSLFVITYENYSSKIFLQSRKVPHDRALLCIAGTSENISVSFVRCAEFDKKQQSHFTGRRDPPPRTMGDGFTILQTARLHFYYNQAILGIVQDDFQSVTEHQPVWESVWRFEKNTVFSYGPWADAQRTLIYEFFFPPTHSTSPITVMPKRGERRILLAHDARICVLNDASFDLWFMRADELNALHLRFKQGSSVDLNIPWITLKSGYSTLIRCCLLFVDSSTSLPFSKFMQSETFRLSLVAVYPRVFNAPQLWKFKIEVNKLTAWFTWDHKRFFTDLINEWSGASLTDIYNFVPYTWDFEIEVSDSFELILVLNDKNWVDTKSFDTPQNTLAALVGKRGRINFLLPFVDFCPQTINTVYEITAYDTVALRFWLPPTSPMFPVLHSLLKNSRFTKVSPSSADLATHSSLNKHWVDIWRSEKASFLFDYTYYPIYNDYLSDLPYDVITLFSPRATSHPYQLTPNDLTIEVLISESEVVLVGSLIKLILDLKDNYFGLYDQVSEIRSSSGMTSEVQRGNVGDYNYSAEEFRPVNVKFSLRLLKAIAHCALHSGENDTSPLAVCPILSIDELVVELVKEPLEAMVQVNLGSAFVQFDGYSKLNPQIGFLLLETLSFRGHGLYSELDVPWEFGSVEYAWMMEVIVGKFFGSLSPRQVVSLADVLESLVLLAVSPDEVLLVPERYHLCHHMNDIHTCPWGALCLVDSTGRMQNCESEEKLKYKMFRFSLDELFISLTDGISLTEATISPFKLSFCNCHEASFSENIMVKVPLITVRQFLRAAISSEVADLWLECTHLVLNSIELDVRLPYTEKNIYLFQEKKSFLSRHDKASRRLYFLSNDRAPSCSCFGSSRFFGERDALGEILLVVPGEMIAKARPFTESPLQPSLEQSILYKAKSVYSKLSEQRKFRTTDALYGKRYVLGESCVEANPRLLHRLSIDSFHSALSSTSANFAEQMNSSILSSPVLLSKYTKLLRSGYLKLSFLRDEGDEELVVIPSFDFKEVSSGLNAMRMPSIEKKRFVQSSMASSPTAYPYDKGFSETDSFVYGTNHFALYVRGSLPSSIQFFITPLTLEVFDRICQQIGEALLSVHPSLIVQHFYTFCSLMQHKQPLTKTGEPIVKEKQQIFCNVSLPEIQGSLFQCGLIDSVPEVGHSLSPRCSVAAVNVQKSLLLVSTRHMMDEDTKFCVDCEHIEASVQLFNMDISQKTDFLAASTPPFRSFLEAVSDEASLKEYYVEKLIEIGISDLSVYFNSGPNASTHRLNAETDFFQMSLGLLEFSTEVSQKLDKSNRKQRSFCDVITSFAASWVSAIYRLKSSLAFWSSEFEEYVDLQLTKLLNNSLDSDMDQIFSVPYSCFSQVKANACTHLSCPSCLLILTLLRYCMIMDAESIRAQLSSPETHILEVNRKQAIVALLSHWQTIICSQIQLVDRSVAKKFVEEVRSTDKEARICIENDFGKSTTLSNGDKSARSTGDSQQMDLYHWITARRNEHREASRKPTHSKKTLEDTTPVNPMEINLLAFFWPIYQWRRLAPNRFGDFFFEPFKVLFTFELREFRIDLVEPRVASSTNINYMSVARDRLLQLDDLVIKGHGQSYLQLDELKLRPVKLNAEISHVTGVQNVRLALSWISVHLMRDVIRMCGSVRTLYVHSNASKLNSTNSANKFLGAPQLNPALFSETCYENANWDQKVLDKLSDYKRSAVDLFKYPSCSLYLKCDGSVSLRVIVLEMTFTQLFLSATFKKLEIWHEISREEQKLVKLFSDNVTSSVQRANLILSEFVSGLDARHIANFSVNTNTFKFKRVTSADGSEQNFMNVSIGDVEGDIPMHAESLHEVVLRNAPKLNEQITLLEVDELTVIEEQRNRSKTRGGIMVIYFAVDVNSIELNALILPSLRAKYRLDKAASHGKTGSDAEFFAEVQSHIVNFTVIAHADHQRGSLSSDTFALPLPFLIAHGNYRSSSTSIGNAAENVKFCEGGYFEVDLAIGKMDYVITTDLLNQVLFAEQCFRSELSIFLERLTGTHLISGPTAPQKRPQVLPPLLYFIQIHGESSPWLQLTACTPTATAVRLTCGNIAGTLTNRWIRKDSGERTVLERVYGKATIGLSAKLGQLVKTAMFEEIETELQEYASFMTQISLQNKGSNVHTSYNYVITVNRPILLIKSTAIDKAILLWLNYKNTYNFWHEERDKVLKKKRKSSFAAPSFSSSPASEPDMNVNLSLKVTNGAYVCMPLYNPDLSANMSALVISLKSTDITVSLRKELACQAAFHNFKVQFMDNFDVQALDEAWLECDLTDPTQSNYFFFPEGTYQFVSQASDVGPNSERARWTLSVKWQMLGMVVDLDHRIGKLTFLLMRTFSFMANGDNDDVWDGSARDSLVLDIDINSDQDVAVEDSGEFNNTQIEGRTDWIERKMHEQSVLVTDLMQCHASENEIERERRKLRQFEIALFRVFCKSVLKKLKRSDRKEKAAVLNKLELPSKSLVSCTKTHARTSSSGSAALLAVDLTRNQSTSRLSDITPETSVDMDIDVQISVESGSCTFRAVAKQDDHLALIKRPSTKDLKAKGSSTSDNLSLTKLAIPSVDVKAYYTSLDLNHSHMQRSLVLKFPNKQTKRKKPAFYLAIELSSMPQESLITPNLADYLEQLLEPFPQGDLFESSNNLNSLPRGDEGVPDVPIVEMDTSTLPMDVLFHLVVQSSTLRFEGQQTRSAAADCLLKLPSLTLIASTKSLTEVAEGVENEISGGGIHLSATLSAFSLNVYSPHQKSTAHDALSLTLDRLCLLMSRSKNDKHEIDNKVQFELTINVGSANFNYDMRRLAELISFPKPWYRKNIIRRLFIGEHAIKDPEVKRSPSTISDIAPAPMPASEKISSETEKRKEWSANVLLAIEWKELDINAQMANTMGNTKLVVREGILQGFCQLNSKTEKKICANFRLNSSSLTSHGGAISGEIFVSELDFNCSHRSTCTQAPENQIKMQFNEIECRIEWMSRAIFIGRCRKPSFIVQNEWIVVADSSENVNRVTVAVNISCSWNDLQMVITKATVEDFKKIFDKLKSFFKEQMTSSRRVWGFKEELMTDMSGDEAQDTSSISARRRYRHWPDVLDTLTEIQSKYKLIPMPVGEEGVTSAGGSIEMIAGHISLACMHGEMSASSWALFHMREVSIIFVPEAQYSFISANNDIGVRVSQRVTLRLGDLAAIQQNENTESLAVVCRVQQGRGSMMRQTSSIRACLEHMIGDVLKQLKLQPEDSSKPTAHHFVLALFQFPAFDAVLTSIQEQETEIDELESMVPTVRSSLICEFHDTVNVQTDFNAQVSFLPELLKTYMKNENSNTEEKDAVTARDFRQYVCETWEVDPRIRFIDRFKWNPPVVDEILRKLQIFDHRMTIPKALQRGLLDPCDALLAQIHLFVLALAKRTSLKQNPY